MTPSHLPFSNPSDHDVIIEVRTLLGVLMQEVRDMKASLADQIGQKAEKTVVEDLTRRVGGNERRINELSKKVWLMFGGACAIGVAAPIIIKLLAH